MNRIKEYRQKASLTQQSLADLMGCEQGTISNYENEIRMPDLNSTKKLISIFRSHGISTDLEDLFPCDTGDTAA